MTLPEHLHYSVETGALLYCFSVWLDTQLHRQGSLDGTNSVVLGCFLSGCSLLLLADTRLTTDCNQKESNRFPCLQDCHTSSHLKCS
jgi:hypothetical protein